jgi:hypothetical protein
MSVDPRGTTFYYPTPRQPMCCSNSHSFVDLDRQTFGIVREEQEQKIQANRYHVLQGFIAASNGG